jgi:hypothetical protein
MSKNKTSTLPADDQLKGMATHLEYEIGEFRRSVRKFADLKQRADADRSEKNRVLESALLHFRILRAFFFGEGAGKDAGDVFARHYCAPPPWAPKDDPVFEGTRTALSKRLTHLTLDRLTAKNWHELDSMIQAIEANVEHFLKSLPTPRSDWFPSLFKTPSIVAAGGGSNDTLGAAIVDIFNAGPKPD